MNRAPLNQTPLGSGTSNNLVRVVITQVLELVGSLRGTVLKYTSITQEHLLEQSLHVTYWVTEKLESLCTHVASLVYGVETGIATALSSTLELVGSCNGTKETNSRIESLLSQESTLVYTVEHLIPFSGVLEHTLEGVVIGYDLNTSIAPVERQIVCPAEDRSLAVSV